MPDIFKINNSLNINTSNIILGIPGTGYQYISSSNLNTGNNHTFNISNPIGSGLNIIQGRLSLNPLNTTHLVPPDPDIIYPISGAFPTISAGERLVKSYNVGNIGNQRQVLVIFFNSAVASFNSIKNGISDFTQIGNYSPSGCIFLAPSVGNKNKPVPYFFNTTSGNTATTSSIIVHKNYRFTQRFSPPGENSGTGVGVVMDSSNRIGYGGVFNYANIGTTLFGWTSGSAGLSMYTGYKVQMEGAWLSDSGNNTLLNFAFINNGTITAPGSGIWMGLYLL